MKAGTQILTESGTNEIEIFEFIVDKQSYGINALKVREVTQYEAKALHEIPMMPVGMLGTVLVRDQVTKVVDLRDALGLSLTERSGRPILMFCDFNKQIIGFVVDEIKGIHRISWNQVQSPSPVLATNSITGVAIIGQREVSMLDLESLMFTIFGMTHDEVLEPKYAFAQGYKVLIADDSPLFRKKLNWLLTNIGIKDFEIFENGAMLLDRYSKAHDKGEKIDLVLSDIEMPQLDGLTCCKHIKKINGKTPVVMFSSLINDQITAKCKEVGADLAINKEDFSRLNEVISNIARQSEASAP